MLDKKALEDDLTRTFINYQHRLDCPMPSTTETPATIELKYLGNPIFREKVDRIVIGVMCIIDKHT